MQKIIIHYINGIFIKEYAHTNIYIIENVFDSRLCELIITAMNNSKMIALPITNNQNVECYSIKKLQAYGLDDILRKKLLEIADIIMLLCPRIQIVGFSSYELRKVYGKTNLHIDGALDNINSHIRTSTVVLALNNNFTGGVYSFPYHNIKFSLNTGSAVFFPPYWTHPHEVSSIGNGEYRYIFSSWGLQ
jgi:hypothetical protein